ncbi:MAG: hypothetical protein ACE15F_18605 [bacterium]
MNNASRQRLLTLIAMICAGALIGDRLVITPLTNLWRERSEKIAALEKDLARGRLLLDRETDLTQRWETIRRTSLPQDKSLAENQVLKSWDRWVKESGITPTTFKPQWKQEEEDYQTFGCRAVAQGHLAGITRFLYELERDPLAVRLESLEITSNDDKGERLTLGVYFSGLRLVTPEQ